MCAWGNYIKLKVPISKELSYTGKARWAIKPIDSCIAPIVKALNKSGILTKSCCCGHGKKNGAILLQDGRKLLIKNYDNKIL